MFTSVIKSIRESLSEDPFAPVLIILILILITATLCFIRVSRNATPEYIANAFTVANHECLQLSLSQRNAPIKMPLPLRVYEVLRAKAVCDISVENASLIKMQQSTIDAR